ncbi:MAG: Bug family tripartite tricarboxylate transporter substrate binding protein [Lautropia sp.]
MNKTASKAGPARRIALAAAFALSIASTGALAQKYPNKPVKIIVAYQAGQGTDVATRYFADELSKSLGQSFVVQNNPGAGGNIGTALAANAAPDGYTLVMGTVATHTMNEHMYSSLGYKPDSQFEPITLTGMLPMVISANVDTPYKTLADLIAADKAAPGKLNVALPSTTARIVYELFKQETGATLFGVAYKGSASAMTDVIGGTVPLTIDTVTATRAQSTNGKLRPLAITTAKASPLLPGVPSVAEQGVKDFQVTAWNALFAPKGTPAAVIDTLSQEMAKILARPETERKLMALGFEARGSTPKELDAFVRSERARWGALIRKADIKLN